MNTKRSIGILAMLLAGLFCTLPTQAAVLRDSLHSDVLGVNKYYTVYLPPSFKQDAQAHYPILYLLHGLTDNDRAWTEKGQIERVLDELIGCGEIPPMVVIMPNAGERDTRNIQSGYFNMPGWRYEDFFFTELLPAVEAKYRAGGSKEQRAVAGLSMGGGGSVGYAMAHPDLFAACYAMSAWLDSERHDDAGPTDKMALLMNAVNDHNPMKLLEQADDSQLTAIRSVRWYIDCGDDDFLLEQNVQLMLQMRKSKVAHQLRVRDGSHNWEYWHNALRLCLPFVSRAMGR